MGGMTTFHCDLCRVSTYTTNMDDAKNASPFITKVFPMHASFYSESIKFDVCETCLKDFHNTVQIWVAKRRLLGPQP